MSYDFNGSTANLNISSEPVSVTPMTFACWFYTDLSHGGSLIDISDTQGNNSWRLWITSSNTIQVTAEAAGSSTTATTTATFSNTTWNHGCGVFSSSTSRTVYLNGANSVTNTTSRTPNIGTITRSSIGSRRQGGTSETFFNGKIADVGIWNIALNTSEINSLSKGVSCSLVRPQNLVFYAPLIRNLFDYSKSNFNINNNGPTVFDLHPGVYL